MVKAGPPTKLFSLPQKNKNKNKTAPRTEKGSHSDPEGDVETTNLCDENENKIDPCHIKQDKYFQNDVTTDQRNGATLKAAYVHQSSFYLENKSS